MRFVVLVVALICVIINMSGIKPVKIVCAEEDSKLVLARTGGKVLKPSFAILCGQKADINSASINEIAQVEGIGRALAEKIVKYRKRVGFIKSMDELILIKGIGPKRLSILMKYFIVRENLRE